MALQEAKNTIDKLVKKPLEIGEVILKSVLSIDAKIDVESKQFLEAGSVVATTDNGTTWKKIDALPKSNPYKLGILGEYVKANKVANIVLIGKVKKVGTIDGEIVNKLFENNIVLI